MDALNPVTGLMRSSMVRSFIPSTVKAEKCSGKIDEVSAMYFSVPEKGGGSLIIGDDGGILYADSSVGYKRHLEAYKQGIRTPID